jgi:hypothetical protein
VYKGAQCHQTGADGRQDAHQIRVSAVGLGVGITSQEVRSVLCDVYSSQSDKKFKPELSTEQNLRMASAKTRGGWCWC